MLVDNRKIWIYWRNLESSYAYANREGIDEPLRTIGPSVSGVQAMLGNSEEQSVLMANIIGVSPNNDLWAGALKNYWYSLTEEIEPTGKELEIGFIYDITAVEKLKYITEINKTLGDSPIKDDEGLRDYIRGRFENVHKRFKSDMTKAAKLSGQARSQAEKSAFDLKWDLIWKIESEHYKFGEPIKVADYLLYKYCLKYSQVANEIALADKSPNIRFYLHSEEEIKLAKERKHKAEKDRIAVYIDTIKSVSKVENILYSLGYGDKIRAMEDDTDLFLLLEKVSKDRPAAFVNAARDKNLTKKGLIEKYIATGILRRLDNTQVVVDAIDPSNVIGNSMDEAVSFFASKKNEAIVGEYKARYDGLPKTVTN